MRRVNSRTNARSDYQNKVDSELESLVLRLAGHMPDLVDDLGKCTDSKRRLTAALWIDRYPAAATIVLEGLASFVADLRKLTKPSTLSMRGVSG